MAEATTSIADILDRAADLIEPEGKWTAEYYAVDAHNEWANPEDDRACAFCMVGAIARAAGTGVGSVEKGPIYPLLQHVTRKKTPHDFNDGHTQAEVVAKLREAAKLAREQSK